MITIYPFAQLGHADHGWLNARHHFSFASYRNPERMGFGALRVINDDIIAAGKGFDTHSHQDMEIITYVRSGAITHRDNQGNEGRTQAGDVQVMSAGTGIAHSEYNHESVDTNIFQIWIEPREKGVAPRWDAHAFPKEPVSDALSLLVSGTPGQAPLWIHQDARIYAGSLTGGASITHALGQQAYLLVSQGAIELDGQPMKKGDGAQITDLASVTLKAAADGAELLLIEVPQKAA